MRLSVADIEALPKGDPPTRCYHCGHEGEITPPGSHFPQLCVDRLACGERQAERRSDGINPVAMNQARCLVDGHTPSIIVHRRCLTGGLVAALRNLGRNRWELWRPCIVCNEILASVEYDEATEAIPAVPLEDPRRTREMPSDSRPERGTRR